MKCISSTVLVIWFLFTCYEFGHTYRPFATEDAGVAGKGVIQLEVSYDFVEERDEDKEHNLLLVPIYGITERIELSAEIPCKFLSPKDGKTVGGVGDIALAGKILLLEEKGIMPTLTIKPVLKTPTGDKEREIGTGHLDFGLFAVKSKTLGKLQLHSMLGYTIIGDEADEIGYGVGGDYNLMDKIHLVGELTGSVVLNKPAEGHPMNALIGVIYNFSGNLIFDVGLRLGITEASPKLNITAGISVTFK